MDDQRGDSDGQRQLCQGQRQDASGPAIGDSVGGRVQIGEEGVVADDRDAIVRGMTRFADEGGHDLVFTTGERLGATRCHAGGHGSVWTGLSRAWGS